MQRVGVVVLAGGASRRWAGVDKTAALLAGRPVLGHVLDGVRAAFGPDVPVVVVGPAEHPLARSAPDGVRWVREEPPGGGPVAGLAAGVGALPTGVLVVGVLAGDAPFAAPALHRLVAVLAAELIAESAGQVEAVIGQDSYGRRQPLLGAYARAPLEAALAAKPVAGRALHDALAALAVRTAPVDEREALDLDTPADLEVAAALVDP